MRKYISIIFTLLLVTIMQTCSKKQLSSEIKETEANVIKDPEKARQIAQKMLKENPINSDKLKILFILTNASNLTGHLSDAASYGAQGIDLAIQQKDTLTQIKLYGILGNLYQSVSLNEKTKYQLNQAEKLILMYKIPDSLTYIEGNIYYLKGMNYAKTLDCEMALRYFDKAVKIYNASHHPLAALNLKLTYLNRGLCFAETGDNTRAEASLKNAYIPIPGKEELASIPPEIAKRQNIFVQYGIARIKSNKGLYSESTKDLEAILRLPAATALIRSDIYQLLSINLMNQNDIVRSEKYRQMYEESQMTQEKKEEAFYNTIIKKEKENSNKKRIYTDTKYLVLCSLLILTVAFVLISLNRKTIKIRKKFNKIKKEILK